MHAYCPECYQKLNEAGIVFPLYSLICENHAIYGIPLAVYEPWWKEPVRYLEINGFITTSEASDDIIFAAPKIIQLDDADTWICCSGNCAFSEIDFNAE